MRQASGSFFHGFAPCLHSTGDLIAILLFGGNDLTRNYKRGNQLNGA